MEYQNKTKDLLIQEISKLNQQINKLKKSEDKNKQELEEQQVLYNISRSVNSPISLIQLYKTIHKELGKIINTTNFYISLSDVEKNKLVFPYFKDTLVNHTSNKRDAIRMLSTYVVKTKKSLLINYKQFQNMIVKGKIKKSKKVFLIKIPNG